MPLTPEQLAASNTESAHQTALFAWASQPDIRAKLPEVEFLFHVPNGGSRDRITAGKLKAEGVRSGVWDLMLPVPRGKYHGLWIEMKVGHNTLSQTQKRFGNFVVEQGYATFVAYSWLEAAKAIWYYLTEGNPIYDRMTKV